MPKVNKKQNNEDPRKRKSLTAAQKKEICLKKISTPSLKQKELAIEYDVSEGMISDILKTKDRWLAIDLNSYQAGLRREKKLPFIAIEEALALWVEHALEASLNLSDDILLTKALEFAFLCNEENLKDPMDGLPISKKDIISSSTICMEKQQVRHSKILMKCVKIFVKH